MPLRRDVVQCPRVCRCETIHTGGVCDPAIRNSVAKLRSSTKPCPKSFRSSRLRDVGNSGGESAQLDVHLKAHGQEHRQQGHCTHNAAEELCRAVAVEIIEPQSMEVNGKMARVHAQGRPAQSGSPSSCSAR